MTMKTPVKLNPARAWRTYTGGARISKLHGESCAGNTSFPEELIISTVEARNPGRVQAAGEGLSVAEECGKTLKSLIEEDPEGMLGARHLEKIGPEPGVLVKLIDSAERLTIQAHPDKAAAKKLFHSAYGKTECWHFLEGASPQAPDPCIYFGFKPGVVREDWKKLFDRQDIEGMLNCLHRFPVKRGDTFLIPGGLPHAIGAGCFLVEIQEPTDFTIRTERVTPAGLAVPDFLCHQGLGFDKMFDCFAYQGRTREETLLRCKLPKQLLQDENSCRVWGIVGYRDTPCFRMELLEIGKSLEYWPEGRFSGLYFLSGEGEMHLPGEVRRVKAGDQFFVPAESDGFRLKNTGAQALTALQCYGPEL